MATVDATSEVFMTAFRALPEKMREAVIEICIAIKSFVKT